MTIFLIFLLCFSLSYLLQTVWNIQYDIKNIKNDIEYLKNKDS